MTATPVTFTHTSDAGTITWTPGPDTQANLATAPAMVILGIQMMTDKPLDGLMRLLSAALGAGRQTSESFTHIEEAHTQAALLMLATTP